MAHEIETMAYVGETPWHSLGVRLDNPPTTAEAMAAAGMNWEVATQPLYTRSGVEVTHRATYRVTDGRILGVVGPDYTPLQNADAFSFFDPFLAAGEATIETAGSLKGGRRVWVLAKLNRDPSVIVPGDAIQKYVLLANSHDGTLAGRVGFTPIRVVCNNTLSAAVTGDVSKLLRVRHTKGVKLALEAVRETMNLANATFEATAEQYRGLARKQVNAADLETYIKLVFPTAKVGKAAPAPKPAPIVADDGGSALESILAGYQGVGVTTPLADIADETVAQKESRSVEIIRELFEGGQGSQLPGVRGTYWAAYNAVTEYTTHHRGRSDENRLSAMFADGAAINARALNVATTLATRG